MKNTILGSIAVIVAVVGAAFVSKDAVVNVTTPAPVVNVAAPKVTVEAAKVNVPATVVNTPAPTLGAVSSQELPQPYLYVGGVGLVTAKSNTLIQASSTICSLKSPAATSTLISAGVNVRFATTTAVGLQLSNSTSYTASSSDTIGYDVIAAGGSRLVVASTTQAYAKTVFLPNAYFIARMDNVGGSATAAPQGSCQAVWMVY